MTAVDVEVVRARAYLLRVAEPPAAALSAFVAALGPVVAAARVRAGTVPEEVARETTARRGTDLVDADLDAGHAGGARLLTPEHPDWPHWAFAAFDRAAFGPPTYRASGQVEKEDGSELAPPLGLWVRGSGSLADLVDRSAAVVGARAATSYGVHVAGELAVGLAAVGFTVVSGAAIGVDGAAHRGALAGAGPTIAVLACGVDRSYPVAHEALLQRIAATGLVVSEYPPGAVPARHRFLVRNRLIAGLAAGTVVVEAGQRSGAQRTAADAHALGRPVMAVPGPVTSGRSAGCHRLIRAGAVLVTRVEEVLEEVGRIGEHLAPTSDATAVRPTDGLGPEAALVHDALPARAACGIPWLATEAGVPPGAVHTALDELTRRGLVEHRNGRWQRTSTP